MLDKHYSSKCDPQKDIENLEDEDEDTVTYVLQMVTDGYNIKEKILEANEALFSTNDRDAPEKSRKTLVKFNDTPEKFEFIYGDYENETWNITIAEDDEDDEFLTEDELIALIPNVSDATQDPEIGNGTNTQSEVEIIPDRADHKEGWLENCNKKVDNTHLSSKKNQKNKELKKTSAKNAPLINCREHCLELNSKEVFQISQRPDEFAFVLPLHKRNCCETSAKKVRLPKYNGKYSQYGLTQEQIDQKLQQRQRNLYTRDKNRDLSAKKQQFRSQISEEEFQKWLVKKCCRTNAVNEVKAHKKVVKCSSANWSFNTKLANRTPSGFHKYERRESSTRTGTNRVKNPFQEITNGLTDSDSPISLQLQNVKRRCGTWADVVEYAFIIN